MIPGGYILISRKIEDSDIMSKPPLFLKVWVWLLIKAKFKDSDGLKRGQVRTSMPEIQEAMTYKVGYRKEVPSIKEIRDVLDWLRRSDEGSTKGTMTGTTKVTRGQVITIQNYDYYQDVKNYEGHNEGHNEGSAKVTRRAQYIIGRKECNERNEGEIKTLSASEDADCAKCPDFYETKRKRKLSGKRLETFNLFWKAFAYPKGKAAAADSWLDIPELRNGLVQTIVAAAEKYAEDRKTIVARGGTPKWAQGWLTEKRWEDGTVKEEPEDEYVGTPWEHVQKL